MNLGLNIKKYRLAKEMTQEELNSFATIFTIA